MACKLPDYTKKTENRLRIYWLLVDQGTKSMRKFFLAHASDRVLEPDQFSTFLETHKKELDEIKKSLTKEQCHILFPPKKADIDKLDMTLLHILIRHFCKEGIEVVRQFLAPQQEKFPDFIKKNENKLDKMKKENKLSEVQYNMLFPPEEADINTLDLDLLHILIRNCIFSVNYVNGLTKKVTELKKFRNDQAHIDRIDMSDEAFNTEWDRLSDILLALGVDGMVIQSYLTKDISVNDQNYIKEIIRREFKEELEGHEEKIKGHEEKIKSLEEGQKHLTKLVIDIIKADGNDGTSLSHQSQTNEDSKTCDTSFQRLKDDLSRYFDGDRYLFIRFLLFDDLDVDDLTNPDLNEQDLLNTLEEKGLFTTTNVNLLLEITKVSEIKKAEDLVKKYIQDNKLHIAGKTKLSSYRKQLFKALRNVDPRGFGKVIASYNLRKYNFPKVWDAVLHLESEEELADDPEKIERFARCLGRKAQNILLGDS